MEPSQVTAASRNPVEPNPSREGLFLADAGATDYLMTRPYLEALGLRPKRPTDSPMDKS